ncbi:MAG: hypothetical protein J0M12_10730 [Deltaproteobacteria bacterium]|nr:hypothetical protein [Deltaproteobacteria bacterium]
MDPKHQQDIAFTHNFLNYLTAAYQGRFAAFNILQQLGFEGLKIEEIGRTRSILEKVRGWVSDLSNQICLFSASWTTPETFEAQSAYKLLADIQPELQAIADTAFSVLGDAATPQQPQRIKFLISSYGRYAYSRDNYIKGAIEYGKLFGHQDIVEQYTPLLGITTRDVQLVHSLITAYKSPTPVDADFFKTLSDECIALPGLFRTYVHDVHVLLAPYKGGMSFENAGFFGPEILQWQSLGFDPTSAGYWRAYSFTPEEAAAWIQGGWQTPADAFDWRLHGFDAATGGSWAQAGFPAATAARWLGAKYSPDKALSLINQGFDDPDQVKA